ncbi:MAG: diaminopimelate decarboxylase [Holosporales bacterium]|jgi:diaminopimelate decarboxylase
MDPSFSYHNGVLHAEGVSIQTLADTVGTPLYCYSKNALETNYRAVAAAFADRDARLCFAMKSNCNPAILSLFARLGAGADVVSGGELFFARKAGIAPDRIVFSGVGKSKPELATALHEGIFQLNIESESELRLLSAVATELNTTANIALRVNPDVDAGTHAKITTGKYSSKFGIAFEEVPNLLSLATNLPGIKPQGLAVHIGSQITRLEPFADAFTKVARLFADLRGSGYPLTHLDLGGGLGITYQDEVIPNIQDYAAMIKRITDPLGVSLVLEPGRWLTGSTGILVTEVLHRKTTPERDFVIVDAGMNDFKRTALYDARHRIRPVREASASTPQGRYDIVGPVCESTDVFAKNLGIAEVSQGDRLVLLDVGAYGSVMGSTYNVRLPAPEVLVSGDSWRIIRPRPMYQDLWDAYGA